MQQDQKINGKFSVSNYRDRETYKAELTFLCCEIQTAVDSISNLKRENENNTSAFNGS